MLRYRDNFIEFFYYNFRMIKQQLWPIFCLCVAILGTSNKYVPMLKLVLYLIIGYILVYSFLKWRNKVFEVRDGVITITEGVFTTYKNDIPINRVKSVTKKDTFFKRLVGVTDFSVELIGGKNIVFVLSHKDVEKFEQFLGREKKLLSDNVIKIGHLGLFKNLLITSANKTVFLAATSIVLSIFTFATKYFGEKFGFRQTTVENRTKKEIIEMFQLMYTQEFLITFAITSIILCVFSYLLCLFYVYIVYYGFQLTINKNMIRLEYGLLSRREYILEKNNIRSLRIEEPLLYRLFGYVKLSADNIGFNVKKSSILINPIIKKDRLEDFVKKCNLGIELKTINYKPKLSTVYRFIARDLAGTFVVCCVISFLFNIDLIHFLYFLPFSIYTGFLKWKYTGLTLDDHFTVCRYSKMFTVRTLITHKKYSQSVKTMESKPMKKKGLSHYQIALYSEMKKEVYKMKYLDSTMKPEFLSYLS